MYYVSPTEHLSHILFCKYRYLNVRISPAIVTRNTLHAVSTRWTFKVVIFAVVSKIKTAVEQSKLVNMG
jgi:hypothetical protein